MNYFFLKSHEPVSSKGKMDSSHNVVSLRTARNKIKGAYGH